MNIGIMVSRQTPDAGGGYTFEDEILKAFFLRREESPHRFFLFGQAPARPAHLDSTGLPWLSLHRPRSQRRKQKVRRLLEKMKLRAKSQALDFESYPAFAAQPLDLICYLTPQIRPIADIPYITTVWDVEHRLQPYFPELSLHGEWEARERRYREVFARASYILTPNERGKAEIVTFYGMAPERIRTLAHPTPGFALEEGSRPAAPRSLAHLGIQGDYLFYPAQFWPHKNHACLLLALKALKERYNYRPQLVLSGSDKGNLAYTRQMAETCGVKDQVIFAGFVSREDLVALYRQALALTYASFGGPENLPPLEAFALGCPVIASSIPGALVQLAEAALLVDPTQPDLWADAIVQMRDDAGLRQSHIERGRERAASYISDDFVSDLFDIFDEFAAYRRCWPPA